MKLKTLETALNEAILNPIGVASSEELQTYLKARDEIIALANVCDDGMDTDVTVTSWYTFSNLLNSVTYDDFGKVLKEYFGNKRFVTRKYREICRNICEEITDEQADGVADFLKDLWSDNEAYGCHHPDGSMMRDNDPTVLKVKDDQINKLGDIINKLYHHRGLSADDLSEIQLFIH